MIIIVFERECYFMALLREIVCAISFNDRSFHFILNPESYGRSGLEHQVVSPSLLEIYLNCVGFAATSLRDVRTGSRVSRGIWIV